jgi:hypothetical protein
MHRELGLFSISDLEKGRVEERRADPKDLARFVELESLVLSSLGSVTVQMETTTTKQTELRPSRPALGQKRSLRDESVLQKLLQYRDRIPLSSRIIRTGQS